MDKKQVLNAPRRLDQTLEALAARSREMPLIRALGWVGSRGGDLLPVISLIFAVRENRRTGSRSAALVIVQALVVNYGIKNIVKRERPGATGATHSFPSGHTATAAAVALVSGRGRGWLMTAAVLTGTARVLRGAHWASDVVVGAAIGAGTGRLGRKLLS
jgi:undecaprenyl-diphosphatase